MGGIRIQNLCSTEQGGRFHENQNSFAKCQPTAFSLLSKTLWSSPSKHLQAWHWQWLELTKEMQGPNTLVPGSTAKSLCGKPLWVHRNSRDTSNRFEVPLSDGMKTTDNRSSPYLSPQARHLSTQTVCFNCSLPSAMRQLKRKWRVNIHILTYMYIHTHHTHTQCTHAHTSTTTHTSCTRTVHTWTHTYEYTHIQVHIHTSCTYIVHTCTHIYMSTHTYISMHTRIIHIDTVHTHMHTLLRWCVIFLRFFLPHYHTFLNNHLHQLCKI